LALEKQNTRYPKNCMLSGIKKNEITINDIFQRCSHLRFEEKNIFSEHYVEGVFLQEDSKEWEEILSDILGPAIKRAGEKATESFLDLTIKYGGIQDDQTLFYKKFKENSIIAMIWPWKDNNQATLKIVRFEE